MQSYLEVKGRSLADSGAARCLNADFWVSFLRQLRHHTAAVSFSVTNEFSLVSAAVSLAAAVVGKSKSTFQSSHCVQY